MVRGTSGYKNENTQDTDILLCINTHTHLSLPLHGVDQDDALWQAFVRDEDLVQLVIHRLPRNLDQKREVEIMTQRQANIHLGLTCSFIHL